MGKKVEQAGNWLENKGEQALNYVGNVVENVLNNPLPFIETAILISLDVPPSIASATVTAANGGSMKDIVTAGVATYAGGEIGKSAGAEATSAGASTEIAKMTASAAGASSGATLTALANGQPLDKALETGLKQGALGGATTGIVEAGKSALTPEFTGQGIKVAGSTVPSEQAPGDYSVKADYSLPSQSSVSGLGLSNYIPATLDSMNGASGLIYQGKAGTDTGGLQPARTSAADKLTPSSFDPSIAGTTGYQEPETFTEKVAPPLSPETEKFATKVVGGALSDLFGLGPKVPGAPSAGSTGAVAQGATTGVTTGLAGERGAGEIESKETGKQRQNVWNEASLRLKDALGV